MLEQFFKSRVATVSDSTYCHRITDALTAAGIKCYCKTKDANQRSVFDATRMRAQIGTFGIKPRYITEIFVDKENTNSITAALVEFYNGKVIIEDQGIREVEVPLLSVEK